MPAPSWIVFIRDLSTPGWPATQSCPPSSPLLLLSACSILCTTALRAGERHPAVSQGGQSNTKSGLTPGLLGYSATLEGSEVDRYIGR